MPVLHAGIAIGYLGWELRPEWPLVRAQWITMGLGAFVVVSELARGLLLAQGWCSAVTYFLFKALAAAATGAAAVLVFVERVRTLKHNLEYPLARERVLVRLGYPPNVSLLD